MENRISSLEALKTIVILLVVLIHFSYLFSIPDYLLIFHGRLGYFTQALLFIISGFSLSFGYLDNLNTWAKVKRYLVRRFFRIAPLFYLMIVIWSVYFYFKSGVSFTPFEYIINVTFVFNLVPGMQESIVSDGWYVGVMMLFYLIFPVIAKFMRKMLIALIVLIGSFFISSFFYAYISQISGNIIYTHHNIIIQIPFLLTGIACYLIYRNVISLKKGIFERISAKVVGGALIGAAIFLLYIYTSQDPLFSFIDQMAIVHADLYFAGIIAGCLVMGLVLYPWKGVVNRVSNYIGTRIYSIYILHVFILEISLGLFWGVHVVIADLGLAYLISVLILLGLVLAVSAVTYRVIEQSVFERCTSFVLKKNTQS